MILLEAYQIKPKLGHISDNFLIIHRGKDRLCILLLIQPLTMNRDGEVKETIRSLHGKVSRVADILEALLVSPPEPVQWPDWIGRMTAALAQYESVSREMGPILQRLALTPGTRLEGNTELITNVYLRTKPSPEIEEEDAIVMNGAAGDTAADKDERALSTGTVSRVVKVLQEASDLLKGGISRAPCTAALNSSLDDRIIRSIKKHYVL